MFDGFQLLDLAGPMQVFTTASLGAKDDATGADVSYRIEVASIGGGSIAAQGGLKLDTCVMPDTLAAGTTIVAVGGAGVEDARANRSLVDWLRAIAPQAERVCSICNGAFFLARAGLLDGRSATTHWADCDALRRQFAHISVDRDAIYVRDGNIWTSAGASAGIDLALALVQQDHGGKAAETIARRLVLYVRRPGNQSQFSDIIELAAKDDAHIFGTLHQWIIVNIDGDLSVPALASRAGMSERSFARKYTAAVGMTPAEGVNRLRAETARNHLRASKAPLKVIARKSGFGSAAHMNSVLLKLLGTSAQVIRETA